jgi:hypothetical protein
MNTPTKLGVYALGLVVVFGAMTGIGNAVGPVGNDPPAHGTAHTDTESTMEHTQQAPAAEHLPGGLTVSQNGYTFELARQLQAGDATPVAFRIVGPNGQPVTAYDKAHDKDLHLIAVRRDLSGFQHVHPELAVDGTWSTTLNLNAGSWRIFADFDPAGDAAALVLGADTSVAGDYQPTALPAPSRTAAVDGYTVTLDGDVAPGQDSELTLSVNKDGEQVTDLQPYLAAYGHLVALRDGDLAYLHVHPAGAPGDGKTPAGPGITFYANTPTAGAYRLFLDFKHGDVVRTAEFTVRATGAGTAGTGHDGPQHRPAR